ncbi:MAG: hypothetical protein R3A47_01455 [Polyangiales bacterium]
MSTLALIVGKSLAVRGEALALALVYAIKFPARVTGTILQGFFFCGAKSCSGTTRRCEPHFSGRMEYLAPIPESERDDLMQAYHKRLTSDDRQTRLQAARAWSVWEGATSRLVQDPQMIANTGEENFAEAFARIENHYFVNAGFLPSDNWILENVDSIRSIPTTIVQGRYDVVCPTDSAWALHRALPDAEFNLVLAGHSALEPAISDALVAATEKYRSNA